MVATYKHAKERIRQVNIINSSLTAGEHKGHEDEAEHRNSHSKENDTLLTELSK
jgi:hypothetical protein